MPAIVMESEMLNTTPKPYCLSLTVENSHAYYETVSAFTNWALARYSPGLSSATAQFETFVRKTRCEALRGTDEYIFEMILLGTLWNLYAPKAVKVPAAVTWMLSKLVEMRRAYPRQKQKIDTVRGVVGTLVLASRQRAGADTPCRNTQNFKKLIEWMTATGEYSGEASRLESWRVFFESCEPERVEEILWEASRTAKRFEAEAASALGMYTRTLSAHKEDRKKVRRFGEDYFMFAKKRVEYHLAMFGAEVINRAMRSAFLRTERRIVLLPGCMRGENEKHCRARRRGLEMTCVGCAEDCHIGQIQRQGRAESFEVRIISHSSSFSKWLDHLSGRKDLGIVGVTCVPNVLQGGYEMKKRGIPAQCVLLDFAGCQKHWLPQNIPTCVDRGELARRLGHIECQKSGCRAS